jgi:hypothetical protein
MNLKNLLKQKKFQYKIALKLPHDIDRMDNTDIINNYNLNRIKSRIPEYFSVCFNYALNNPDILDLETAFECTLYNYIPVHIADARAGDMVTFHRIEPETRGLRIPNERTIEHFAIISGINIDKNILNIRSKFGQGGIFEGRIDELPVFYGNHFVIWRKQNKTSPTTKMDYVKEKTVSFLAIDK